ncbi:MAG: type III pantothenate kinase [Candidatus Eisenbacteria bacterium]|uniref:Type III pantothenate kinase n=1 Tax=Eiseniibacteriota bacterium TaxID=2212470 RepID=A0A538SE25_UNCEI|nr:MAG: type III pantothenate kinase [Candidatus Eisenbacteria bacterium]
MLLAIDVGNTEVTLGLFDGRRLTRSFRLSSETRRTADEISLALTQIFPELARRGEHAAVLASVVPTATASFLEAARKVCGVEPLEVSSRIPTGVDVEYRDPQSAGADRIANAAAALALYGAPVVIVDFGTATTFDVILRERRYIGGVIAPGIVTGAEHLIRRAARLSAFELKPPPHVVGRSTEESLQSGVYYGAVGQVDAIVRRIAQEERIKPRVIATGGLAPMIAKHSETIEKVDPDLTLHGLRIIQEMNGGAGPAKPKKRRE